MSITQKKKQINLIHNFNFD